MNYLVSLFLLLFISGCTTTKVSQLPTVSSVDINKYMGTWIEIARYENRFEKECISATAQYALQDNVLNVTNRCYDANGLLTGQAQGSAYAVEGSNNSKLKVSFFWPFYGDYWVIMLGENYRYSVVSDPTKQYLWILARTAPLDSKDKELILAKLSALGYDISKLYWTKPLPQ